MLLCAHTNFMFMLSTVGVGCTSPTLRSGGYCCFSLAYLDPGGNGRQAAAWLQSTPAYEALPADEVGRYMYVDGTP